jgi:oligoendopeptidase F
LADGMMKWDLSQLVEDTRTKWLTQHLNEMVKAAEKLRTRFYGKIEKMEPAKLLELLVDIDDYNLEYDGTTLYCNLIYSANSLDSEAKTLNDAEKTAITKVGQLLAFIDVELSKLLSFNPNIINDPVLVEYKHYLERKLRGVPYILSEKEEQLIISKDKNGIDSWSQLQGDWLGTRMFEIEIKGEKRNIPYGEIIALYEDEDRDLRRRANQTVYRELGEDEILWASAIRAICSDHNQMCEWRKYPTTITQSLIANDVDQETVDALMAVITHSVGVYQRYLRLKAKIMGLEKLANYDIVAPLPESPRMKFTWNDSRSEVTQAYDNFDVQLGQWIQEMYSRRHIDGEPRKGKRSGAFCSTWFSGKSAYVLQSFNGKLGDIYTQAHELGHAMHAYLGSRAQKPSNYEIGSCIAECGSTFGELLLTEHLLDEAKDDKVKQAVLTKVLDEFGMAAFQVSARFFFEHSLYDAIKRGEYLDGDKVAMLWTKARDDIYGDSVDWLPEMKWEWTMKLHYYIPNYRFYNYPYVFAQLFVFGLFRLYKEQGKKFVPKLKDLLSAGSSQSPRQLALNFGIDINTKDFWEKGIEQASAFVDMLDKTVK